MSDLFAPFKTPSPSPELRARVLAATASERDSPGFLHALDVLWGSRVWWLAWSASVVLALILGSGPEAAEERTEVTAESWQRYRAGLTATLAGAEAVGVPPASLPGRGVS